MHAGCLKAMLLGEKGSRAKSGATAITVFCQADAKAIGRMPEKAQLHENSGNQSGDLPCVNGRFSWVYGEERLNSGDD